MKIFLCIFLFLIYTNSSFCTNPVGDTLAFNQTLRAIDNETLVSANGKFELGFFSRCNCSDHYLGIWFRNIPLQTVIWVANRDNPVTKSSGAVTITEAGNIIIYEIQPGNVVWSSNSSAAMEKNPVLQLLDSGNLVVEDGSFEDDYVWESFNYPSDTLIEGMKQGWNRRTGQNWYLTSWRSNEDPSTGEYTFMMDPIGLPEIYLRMGSQIVHRKGPYDGVRFGGGPRLKSYPVFMPKFVHNETYDYSTFEDSNDTIVSMFVLRCSGRLEHRTWIPNSNKWLETYSIPRDQCDNYAKCGPNGICSMDKAPICNCPTGFVPKLPDEWDEIEGHSGCVLRTPRNCSGRNEGFKKFSKLKMPANSYIMDQGKEMSQLECERACLRNCSCSAYAMTKISSCVMWFGDLMDTREYSTEGQTMYIRMAASDIGYDKKRLIVLASTMSGFLVLVSLGCYMALKKKFLRQTGKITGTQHQNDGLNLEQKDMELKLFDLSTIAVATCKFSLDNKIGQGGFGPVYKGKLFNGQEIAVKTLSKSSRQGLKEFKSEVRLMAILQHRNLVRLLGCCIHADDRMLVYEYMPNSSLDYHIFDETKGASLGWQNRFDIIVGVARGLLYLHRDSRMKIIHRDLKASNVLLDSKMNPKISDFGLARMFGCDQGEEKTCRVMGTYGYMSPEYAIDGQFSVKSDVFSFGVLVLEIISGQRNREFYHPDHDLNLLGHAWKLWNEDRAVELLTKSLNDGQPNVSEVLKCINIGLLCVQQRPEDRPEMSSVVLLLGSDSLALPQASEPAYYYHTDRCLISHRKPLHSENQVSVTTLHGR